MHEGPTENRLGELGSLYKYYYYYYYYKSHFLRISDHLTPTTLFRAAFFVFLCMKFVYFIPVFNSISNFTFASLLV